MVGWRVTAEAGRFDEALSHFATRTPLTDEERKRIPADARSRAFWIAGVAQLDVVERVKAQIAKAIEAGTPFEEFKKQVAEDLRTTNTAHLETVFRNATQTAYNAGRWRQMSDPSVARFRPFWMYDAILDSRTTPLCNGLSGTVLPAADPWWDNHHPPLHHRCRSSIRSLRRSEAEKRGITERAPEELPPEGFGLSPRVAREWKPEQGSRDAGLMAELERKRATVTQLPPLPKLPKDFARPANQQLELPLEREIEHAGQRVVLTEEQQRVHRSARLMRSGHSERAKASYPERRDWMLWDWQTGSARTSALMQLAALREFGGGGVPAGTHDHSFQPSDLTRAQRDLRRLYDETRAWFRARKIRTIKLYRASAGGNVDRAIESWTTNRDIAEARARKLGGEVLEITVPIRQVLARSDAAGWVDGPSGPLSEVLLLW